MQRKSTSQPAPPAGAPTHRKLAIFGWLAFVVVSIAVGGAVGTKQLTDAEAVSGESGRAEVALEKRQADAQRRGGAWSRANG